jgi:hypothetical protein
LVETTLPILQSNIDDTMSMVTDTTLIIIGVVIGLLCLLIALMSVYIASPLGKIMVISQQIIAAIGTEESKRDYTTAKTDAFFLQNARGDEIGALTSEFFVVVTMLHNKNVEKKRQPKYPSNPFYLESYWDNRNETRQSSSASSAVRLSAAEVDWESFVDALSVSAITPVAVPEPTIQTR